jgi:hypothetical protein
VDKKLKKLSKAQQDIIKKMRGGWELGLSSPIGRGNYYFVLQKGGLGRGGATLRGDKRTIYSLLNMGLIAYGKKGFPDTKMHLTAKARGY